MKTECVAIYKNREGDAMRVQCYLSEDEIKLAIAEWFKTMGKVIEPGGVDLPREAASHHQMHTMVEVVSASDYDALRKRLASVECSAHSEEQKGKVNKCRICLNEAYDMHADFLAYMHGELAKFECCCCGGGHKKTPPLMWPELIACIAKKAAITAEARIRELEECARELVKEHWCDCQRCLMGGKPENVV